MNAPTLQSHEPTPVLDPIKVALSTSSVYPLGPITRLAWRGTWAMTASR